MTTRPGNGMLQRLPLHSHQVAECHKVTRNDGFTLRITSHDRPVWFEGETYTPAVMQAASADRREALLRAGEQQVFGVVDGVDVLATDLLTFAFRGARVESVIVDYARPWLIYGRYTRWIRSISRTGDQWTAQLEGRTAKLQRPQAQRFGGQWHKECPYELGGVYCKADIDQWTYGVQVDTVVSSRSALRFSTATFPATNPATAATYVDNFYRDGAVRWLTQDPLTVKADWDGLTLAGVLTDSSESWTVDEHAGRFCIIFDSSGDALYFVEIASNTATTLTFVDRIASVPIGGSRGYQIAAKSRLYGTSSPIVRHEHANRDIELLIPTPADFAVGDWAIITPGCDGLLTTCRDKFDNVINHGGDQYAPSGHKIIEPPEDNG